MAIAGHHLTGKPPPPVLFSPRSPKFIIPFAKPRLHHHRITKIPSSSFRNGSNTPSETGCPVPLDQQPINEYQNLSTSFPFSLAANDIVAYCSRLFVFGAAFALFIGLPVAWFGSVRPESEPWKPILAAASSGILVVSLAVVRMYLGWAYVGNRLLSATVECNSICFLPLLVLLSYISFYIWTTSSKFFTSVYYRFLWLRRQLFNLSFLLQTKRQGGMMVRYKKFISFA